MSLEATLEQDLKSALLAGDTLKLTTLRLLKSTILNTKVAEGTRGGELSDEQVINLFAKEAKKRQESADLYAQAGSQDRADAELAEKAIIDGYLPAQLSKADIEAIVDQVIAELGASDKSALGRVIGQVKARTQGSADGGVIAQIVKEKLQ